MELIHPPSCFCVFSSICLRVITFLIYINLFQSAIFAATAPSGNETDHSALLKFKESVVTDPKGLLNSWNSSIHFCSWHGVTCSTRHQRVVALNLSDSSLGGTISPYIGNLSYLRFINLESNKFSGKIPQQADQLFRLRHLNLSQNSLEGKIPVNLTLCHDLSIISLEENRLVGEIPSEMGSFTKLVFLNLGKNNLTGGIPPSLGNLSSLTVLSLIYNNLVGNVPEEIGRLQSLSIFYIGANKLSGMIPAPIFNISSVVYLSLAVNAFRGTLPPAMGINMPKLKELSLAENEFSGQFPTSLSSNASQLQLIDTPHNYFVGQVPGNFGHLPDLQWLVIKSSFLGTNSSTDLEFMTSLPNCSNLEILDIGYNGFGGVLPNSVANLSTKLTNFYLGGNQITGLIPVTLEKFHNLIILAMETNLFEGVIPASFGKLQMLQIFALHRNRLSGWIPSSIGNLTQLYKLTLFSNRLEGNIPSSIGNCQHLQYMKISHNRLTGDIPLQVTGLSSLLYLNLSNNLLTGSLPADVGKLKNVYRMELSGNSLTGDIPKTIGDCLALQVLFLYGNLFRGSIPSSLASLRVLEYLDLSRNNLSGYIPKELQRLPLLIYLNLSFNNLEGEVPKEGAFRNTTVITLVGNTKLCGGVSELQLPACPIQTSSQKKVQLKFILICLVVGCILLSALFSLYWWRNLKRKQLTVDSSFNYFLSKISYQAIHQATSGFSASTLIGSGHFGTVYKGNLDQEENNVVAVKVLNLQQKGASKSFMAECNALRHIRHRNLVKIITCCSSVDYKGNELKALVFEYMSNGSLEEWLHKENQSRSLTLLQRLSISIDVASALSYLHNHCEPQIIHRDMKPSNVLLDDGMVACVSDFGLARLIPTTMESTENQRSTTGMKGTIGYLAPEYASGVEASIQGDVYSYGILVLEMFTGRRPTDEMFKDGLNLHDFVQMALPGSIVQIVDPALLATIEEATIATPENEVSYMLKGHKNEIEAEEENREHENLSKMDTHVWKCIRSIFKVGLACSEESPKHRMSMEDAVKNLHHVQNAFNDAEISRVTPGKSKIVCA